MTTHLAGDGRDRAGTDSGQPGVPRRSFLRTAAVGGALAVAGCVGGGGGGGGDGPIKIGHIAPVQIDVGKGSMRSARMAVDEINEDGGILDREVELVEGDTQLSPSQANTVVNEMITKDGISMLSGGFASETVLGIEDRVANADVPFLGTGAASPKITRGHLKEDYEMYKNVFRVGPQNSDFQADGLADFSKFLSDVHGWNTFAVVVEDAEWTKEVTARTAERMEDEHGLDAVMNKRIAPDTSDFTPILDAVEESGAKVMMKAIAHISGTSMLSTWSQNEYPFAQEGTNVASMSPAYWADTNGGCAYESEAEAGAGGFGEITEKTVPFRKRCQEAHSSRPTTPMYMGCDTYDAIHIYKNAVEEAGTVDYENDLDAIVDALLATDHVGVTGRVTFFGPDGPYPHDGSPGTDLVPYTPVQWQPAEGGEGLAGSGGTKACVWPEKHATADHVAAPWIE